MVLVRRLEDSGAVIVGGTAGIGLHSALALARAGVKDIVLVGRSAERAGRAKEAFAAAGLAEPSYVQGDAGTADGAIEIIEAARALLPALDILITSVAADVEPTLFKDIPTDDIARTLTSLALPGMQLASAALPSMRAQGGGTIINVASDAGKTATPGEAVIGAAKAALIMFTRSIAIEEKRHGIRANVLTPSLVHGTDSTERITSGGSFSAKLFASAAKQAALGVPDADDVGALAAFLCSPEAARLTGQAISVNGGISAA
ncbi:MULTISPECIES: SDR family oxidoreductase [Gordonia]|uniref:SDR family NAD(P)-dependent oxidoreductase n=1 Tax=Gordonia TaxID=2053 RepID=UPI00326781CA